MNNGTMAAINEEFEAKFQFLKEVLPNVPSSDLRTRLQIAIDKNQTVDNVIEELMNSQDYHPAPEKKSEKIEIDLVSDEPIHWGNDKAVEDDDFKLAMQLYEQELREQYNPNKHIADIHQSRVDQQKGKYEEALKHINMSIDNMDHLTYPDIFRFQYWTEKAKVLEALHRDNEAITDYEHALHIFPHEPHSLVQLTKLYLNHGRESEARALVPRLSSLNTEVESFNKQVADLLAQLK